MGTLILFRWLSYSPSPRSQTDLDFSVCHLGSTPDSSTPSLGASLRMPSLAPHIWSAAVRMQTTLFTGCELHKSGLCLFSLGLRKKESTPYVLVTNQDVRLWVGHLMDSGLLDCPPHSVIGRLEKVMRPSLPWHLEATSPSWTVPGCSLLSTR